MNPKVLPLAAATLLLGCAGQPMEATKITPPAPLATSAVSATALEAPAPSASATAIASIAPSPSASASAGPAFTFPPGYGSSDPTRDLARSELESMFLFRAYDRYVKARDATSNTLLLSSRAACTKGNGGSCAVAGYLSVRGEGVADVDAATRLFIKACDRGELVGCTYLAETFDCASDPTAGGMLSCSAATGAYVRKAAPHGVPPATAWVEGGIALATRACDGELGAGCWLAGNITHHPLLGTKNTKERDRAALELVRRGCALGLAFSCFDGSNQIEDAKTSDPEWLAIDVELRARLFELQKASCRLEQSCSTLGNEYEQNGLSGRVDPQKAHELYRIDCEEQHNDLACKAMAAVAPKSKAAAEGQP